MVGIIAVFSRRCYSNGTTPCASISFRCRVNFVFVFYTFPRVTASLVKRLRRVRYTIYEECICCFVVHCAPSVHFAGICNRAAIVNFVSLILCRNLLSLNEKKKSRDLYTVS